MPAINVARTDTFEIQRQKINQIGDQIFSISQGGSDLATGNLKLGDGTRISPSLAFTSEPSLGLYKGSNSTIEYVSNEKKILGISQNQVSFFKNFQLTPDSLLDSGIVITNGGSNYDPGSYTDITLSGGSGDLATANIEVTSFVGETTNTGKNYTQGTYSDVPLICLTNTSLYSYASFTVDGIEGSVNEGSGYVSSFYENVPLTGGSGSGAEATIVVDQQGTISSVTITNNGLNYQKGDILSADNANLGGSGNGFLFTITSDPGKIKDLVFDSRDTGYSIGENLNLSGTISNIVADVPGELLDVSSTLSTSSKSVFVASTSNIIVGMFVTGNNIPPGTVVESIDSSTQITISQFPTLTGTQNVSYSTPENTKITLSDQDIKKVSVDSILTVSSGNGSLDSDTRIIDVDRDNNTITISKVSLLPGSSILVSTPAYGSGTEDYEYQINGIGAIDSVTIQNAGFGYTIGDSLSVSSVDLSQPTEYTVKIENLEELYFNEVLNASHFSVGDTIKKLDQGVSSFSISSSPTVTPTQVNGVTATISSSSPQITVGSTTGLIPGMFATQNPPPPPGATSGILGNGLTIVSIDSSTLVTLSGPAVIDGTVTIDFVSDESGSFTNVSSTTNGNGTGCTFNVTRNSDGSLDSFSITLAGQGVSYQIGDTLTIDGSLVGGVTSTHDIVLSVTGVTTSTEYLIYEVNASAPSPYLLVEQTNFNSGDSLINSNSYTNVYTLDNKQSSRKYFIDDGNGFDFLPNLTLYVNSSYKFIFSDVSNSSDRFALSAFIDGENFDGNVENVVSTVSSQSDLITISDTTNIIVGMTVIVNAGTGALQQDTLVSEIVDSTTLKLNKVPQTSGSVDLSFLGTEFLESVTKTSDSLLIKVSDSTPTTLYYYSKDTENLGGITSGIGEISISENNPKVFGSGAILTVSDISDDATIFTNINTGQFTADIIAADSVTTSTLVASSLIECPELKASRIETDLISSQSDISLSATDFNFTGNINVLNQGTSTFSVENASGNILTYGNVKSFGILNINDALTIEDSSIKSKSGFDINIVPFSGRIVKIDSTTALVVPSGTTQERPSTLATNGSIRFNTTTGQYEGYNASSSSWSSLGGVRDIDGNTYILAELTPGSNDNTLWFYNDSINTLKLTKQFLDFRSVKKISSGKLGLPTFSLWSSNTAVNIGEYLKHRNNLYEVTSAGTTASSGNEPTHTSGVANNGTAQLTWYSSAVSPLEFTEIEELRVGPNKDCPLIVSSELKIFNSTISTLVEDLTLSPNSGKKVSISASTSLVIPVGNTNQRGSASQGSIRFNTTISQFEGYSGTNWSSLGGVRDVDGNTYIIPESAPAANENILYFYNDGSNTLQLSSTALDFTGIDTITTSSGNSLEIDTSIVTLSGSETTIDNSDSTSTFISTSKQYLDLGLSTGITVDPVLRLDDEGDVYLNTGFGTGTFNGVKIFDGDLKDFELSDYLLKTNVLNLVKGVSNTGSSVLYDISTAKGCKVTVVSKSSSGKKSMAEYSVIDNGTDIFFTEIGSLNTSIDGFSAVFDITPSNETRITLTLSNDHANNDTVEITVLTQVIK